MQRLTVHRVLALALAALPVLTTGCLATGFGADSKLENLIGTWDGEARTTVLATGEVIDVRATTVTEWARPGEVMLERTVSEVAGQQLTAVAVWIWDPDARACRTYRLISTGERETGLARHDPSGAVWELHASSDTASEGRTSQGSGSMRFTTPDEKVYDWVTLVDGVETLRIEGTSRRR